LLQRFATIANRLVFTVAIFSTTLLLASLLSYSSGDKATALAEEGTGMPHHRVLEALDAPGMREVAVATPETGEREMRLIAQELREENTPAFGTLLIEYYDASEPSTNTGFALVFDNKKAVLDAGRTQRFGKVYDEEDAEQITEGEDGIRVVSFEQFAEDNPSVWEQIRDFLL